MSLIQALLLLAVGFGLQNYLTPERQLLIMGAVAAAIAFITRQQVTPVTKLQDNNIDPKKLVAILLTVVGTATALSACSVSQRHQAVIADTAIYTGLAAFQDGEKALYDAGKLDSDPAKNKAKHQAINVVLVKALKSGDALNRTVRGWTPGTATPPELAQHVNDLSALAKTIADNFTDGATKSQLEAWLLTANTAALTIITIATGR
jgi:hypothetical protein